MTKITVFTPTYNRAYILGRLYTSLCNQTCKDFEWLIVDDGSSDNTQSIVEGWINDNLIKIRYIVQKNGGKMRAHNTGVLNTNTELFICFDSDDYLVADAIESLDSFWSQNGKEVYSGIVSYRGYNEQTVLAKPFPDLSRKSSQLYALYESGFEGDAQILFRTDVLRNYLFPEIESEKFITEAYIYNQIDMKYELLLLPKIVCICEYLPDGYSRNHDKLTRDNPKGWALYFNQKSKISRNQKKKFYFTMQYMAYARIGKNPRIFADAYDKKQAILAYFPSLFLYVWRKIRFSRIS